MTCQDIIQKKGLDSRYTKDCFIRLIRGKPYAEAAALVNWTGAPPIVIRAGIGTLILGPHSEDFTPAPTTGQMAKSWLSSFGDRTPASPEVAADRQALCDTCDWMEPKRKVCTACGCGTSAKVALAAQQCPKGRW